MGDNGSSRGFDTGQLRAWFDYRLCAGGSIALPRKHALADRDARPYSAAPYRYAYFVDTPNPFADTVLARWIRICWR